MYLSNAAGRTPMLRTKQPRNRPVLLYPLNNRYCSHRFHRKGAGMPAVRKKPPLSSILADWRSAMVDSAQNDLKFDSNNTLRIPFDEIRAGTLAKETIRRL